jgi:hypothetical protein
MTDQVSARRLLAEARELMQPPVPPATAAPALLAAGLMAASALLMAGVVILGV